IARTVAWAEACVGFAICAISVPILRSALSPRSNELMLLGAAMMLGGSIGAIFGATMVIGGLWQALATHASDRVPWISIGGAIAAPIVIVLWLGYGSRRRRRRTR